MMQFDDNCWIFSKISLRQVMYMLQGKAQGDGVFFYNLRILAPSVHSPPQFSYVMFCFFGLSAKDDVDKYILNDAHQKTRVT